MAESPNAPAIPKPLSPFDEVRFVEDHRPTMDAGDYQISVSQALTIEGETHSFSTDTQVAVMGDRFELHPNTIQSLFPPANARGDFWHVLPHVILSRSTLPWERPSCEALESTSPPWIALLLFDESEMSQIKTTSLKVKDLDTADQEGWERTRAQSGQHADDPVSVIDVPWDILGDLLPRHRADFCYRTHTRRVFPHSLLRRIHLLGRGLSDVIDNLNNVQGLDALTKLFANADIALGDRNDVMCEERIPNETWQVSAPTAGFFEVTYTQHKTGNWLRIKGGLPPDGESNEPSHQHDFIASDQTADQMTSVFDPPAAEVSKQSTMGSRMDRMDAKPTPKEPKSPAPVPAKHLPAVVRRQIPVLDDAATLKRDSGGQVSMMNWRITDQENDAHFLLKLVKGADHDFLDIDGYETVLSEQAVVVANRLPKPNSNSTLHLVSLEGRYALEGDDIVFKRRKADHSVRLVTLKSWDFYSLEDKPDFKTLLEQLNLDGGGEAAPVLRMRGPQADGKGAATSPARPYLRAGFVPMKHHLRQGQTAVSWYRGPLVAQLPEHDLVTSVLPARSADSLLQFNESLGMMDTSYATAWEIGRLTTLAHTSMALELFHWKRKHAQHLNASRHVVDLGMHIATLHDHLAHSERALTEGLPEKVRNWFADLSILRHIPFNYLVPDEAMLPQDSIRFFDVDPVWLKCLHDGAFSIGRVLAKDIERHEHSTDHLPKEERLSGFLLRSEVVTDYPDFTIDGYGTSARGMGDVKNTSHLDALAFPRLECIRREVIGRGVMLCLFKGNLRMVDMHMQPEILHFGLDISDHAKRDRQPRALVKKLRSDDGTQIAAQIEMNETLMPGRDRVIDLTALANEMHVQLGTDIPNSHLAKDTKVPPIKGLNPAIFALEMLAASDLVRLMRDNVEEGPRS